MEDERCSLGLSTRFRGGHRSDALKVLYRLRIRRCRHSSASVRTCLLSAPEGLDIGTSAHPYQVKNFSELLDQDGYSPGPRSVRMNTSIATFERMFRTGVNRSLPARLLLHPPTRLTRFTCRPRPHLRTPEEDAFRRDFPINALFYDIGLFESSTSRRLQNLKTDCPRIGDPNVRFQ